MKNKNKQTKFPVARIKRIMQKDDDVGKVAQATPVVISKALELFLGMIVDEASKVTLQRGARKVEAYHLKHAIETSPIFDFLQDIVQSVADPSAGGTIDIEAEKAERAEKRRRGAGAGGGRGGRRKRTAKAGAASGSGRQAENDEDGDGEDGGRGGSVDDSEGAGGTAGEDEDEEWG